VDSNLFPTVSFFTVGGGVVAAADHYRAVGVK
jgi:hypothetical protein